MIVRTVKNKENPYYLKNRTAPNDKRLSWKAKGIHDYLMSKPDNWEANIEELTKASTDGESAVRSGVKELIDNGYMQRIRITDDKGRITDWRLDTYEQPHSDCPDVGFPHVGFPHVDNRGLISNESKEVLNVVSKEDSPAAHRSPSPQSPLPLPLQESEPRTEKETTKTPTPPIAPAPSSPAAACWEKYLEMIAEYEPKIVLAFGRERAGINKLAKAGRTPEEVESAFRTLKKTPFWNAQHLSAQSLGNQMGAVLLLSEPKQAQVLEFSW